MKLYVYNYDAGAGDTELYLVQATGNEDAEQKLLKQHPEWDLVYISHLREVDFTNDVSFLWGFYR